VNRIIDYGGNYGIFDENDDPFNNKEDPAILRQLKYFYRKDLEKKFSNENIYVKTYYLHHLLDYFKETRHDTRNLELIFQKFLEEKIPIEFSAKNGTVFNFQKEINEIFKLIYENKNELFEDLR